MCNLPRWSMCFNLLSRDTLCRASFVCLCSVFWQTRYKLDKVTLYFSCFSLMFMINPCLIFPGQLSSCCLHNKQENMKRERCISMLKRLHFNTIYSSLALTPIPSNSQKWLLNDPCWLHFGRMRKEKKRLSLFWSWGQKCDFHLGGGVV